MFIVWTNYGSEGWSPTYYQKIDDAVKHESYGMEKIFTKEIKLNYSVKNKLDNQN